MPQLSKRSNVINKIKTDTDRTICVILFLLSVGLSGLGGIFYYIIYHFGLEQYFECRFMANFGIPCPGCGATRAVWFLLHGQILSSIYYYPLVVYTVILLLVYWGSQLIRFLSKDRLPAVRYGHWFWISILVIMVVQYILKLVIPTYII